MTFKNLLFVALLALSFTACKDDDEPQTAATEKLNLNLTGLSDLGSDYAYEGWIMVDGSPVTTGVFTVDANGTPSKTSFDIDATQLGKATAFILTIEPSPDSDPAPSDVHILAGDFSGTNATLTVDHGAALGNDFTAATGTYLLATPTDGMMNNEKSGVWFMDPTAGLGCDRWNASFYWNIYKCIWKR